MGLAPSPVYDATRTALHAVAEHVVAAALHQATGRIGLRATPGGFGTPVFEVGGVDRQVRVEGIELVVLEGSATRRSPLRTIAGAAALVGIEPGGPSSVYALVTSLEPDVPLALDPDAAAQVHAWFALTDAALGQFSQQHAVDAPSAAQLWPEHLDLALTMAEVNYGGSPGDGVHESPYLYVGPWSFERSADELWNEPFGASRPHAEVSSSADALAFFEQGRRAGR
ncbi:MAG: hypothetical protein ABIY48_08255 [Acidimicrobiales bacterium]